MRKFLIGLLALPLLLVLLIPGMLFFVCYITGDLAVEAYQTYKRKHYALR